MPLKRKRDTICPNCGEQGFDGQGYVIVEGIQMYLKQCWSCGVRFACEDIQSHESE